MTGDDRPALNQEEIEITPEMVEAGELAMVDVLYEPLPEKLGQELVIQVYRAMTRASLRSA